MKIENEGWYISKAADGSNTEVKSPMVMHANISGGDAEFGLSILVGEKHPVSPEHSHSEGAIHLTLDQARELSEWLSRKVATREGYLKSKGTS